MKEKIPNPNSMKKIKGPNVSVRNPEGKVRITTYLDADLLQQLRKLAKLKRGKYQTILNLLLKSALEAEAKGDIQSRLKRLEEAVF